MTIYKRFLSTLDRKSKIKDYPLTSRYSGPQMMLHVVQRLPKYTLVQVNNKDSIKRITKKENNTVTVDIKADRSESGFFVAYPTNETHANIFSQSHTAGGGPNDFFPGSAAIVKYSTIRFLEQFHLHYAQFSFKQGSPDMLTRTMAAKYLGARKKLLQQSLSYMTEKKLTTLVRGYQFQRSSLNHSVLDSLLEDDEFAQITEKSEHQCSLTASIELYTK